MWLNNAKFRDNGGCGYVLKPPVMMESVRFDPNATRPYFGENPNSANSRLVIRLIGARQLPKPQKTQVKSGLAKIGTKKKSYPKVTLKICGIDQREIKTKPDSMFNGFLYFLLNFSQRIIACFARSGTNCSQSI